MPFLSKTRRKIYERKIKSFWIDFSHNKVGFLGLIIILCFIAMAISAPALTPYKPISQLYRAPKLAVPYALPAWVKVFPPYADFNPTLTITTDLEKATVIDWGGPIEVDMENLTFRFNATEKNRSIKAWVVIDLRKNFSYQYMYPPQLTMHVSYEMYFINRTQVNTYFIIKNYTANPAYEEHFKNPTRAEMWINRYLPEPSPVGNKTVRNLNVNSFTGLLKTDTAPVMWSLYKSDVLRRTEGIPDPAEIIFSQKGVYGLQVKIEFENPRKVNETTNMPLFDPETWKPIYETTYAELYLKEVRLTIWGRYHGILGTDFGGNDAWTELVYGARISLMVGVLAAVLATTLGILYGVISGYVGGFVDEFLMRIVDILLCIPVLPILLVLTRYYSPSIYFVVVLIAIFGWQGLSRVIRSKVLSLKEMAFIESARASGASDMYLMFRHLIPNVLPIAMAAMVLAVPGAIITEAALSFLGFGDPNAPTWGRILYHAYQLGGLKAWWVWVPPGLAITILCVGFVFIGHAVDEIVNPRLRRRR